MPEDFGSYFERDHVLVRNGADGSPVSTTDVIQALDTHLQSSMPGDYSNVEVITQVDKHWMTISFLNKTMGEEYWRVAVQFHRAPNEDGPQVVSRARVVYTEDLHPDDKFDEVFGDLSKAIEEATSQL